jgi:hypothetical protein
MAVAQDQDLHADIRRAVDRICSMIVSSAYRDEEITAARSELRRKVAECLPDRLEFYDRVYESRFDRLWQQFRANDPDRGRP